MDETVTVPSRLLTLAGAGELVGHALACSATPTPDWLGPFCGQLALGPKSAGDVAT
jgi:hypothetical protein